MRLAAAACALVIVALAVFGAILMHRPTGPGPAAATAPAEPNSALSTGGPVLASAVTREVTIPDAPPAAAPSQTSTAAPTQAFAQAAPAAKGAAPAAATPATPAAAPAAPAAAANSPSCPGNPNALGVSRVVEIDTTGGPGFGFEHFKTHDFLRAGEVVFTFDDGPWPRHTPAVLAALAAHCTKAIFFPIGKHAMWEPGILKQVVAAGHAIGSHTWSHIDLSKKGMTFEMAKDEIEKGISAVRWAAGVPTAPYFRFPALKHPPELVTYLGQRNVGIFSTDFDSFDFKMKKPEQVRQAVLAKLKKFGKGIILMHDFQQATAGAASDLMNDLKAGGYKVVFMKPKDGLKTIASYDELILKDQKLPTVSDRPTSSVVRTISE
jgi:peptidoglycan/xylan/chitin deacetylase (PgdA/CDA1 family)